MNKAGEHGLREASEEITPHFGRLVVACFATLVFCGLLVWLMGDVFSDCCDLSWLGRFVH